MRRAVAIMGLLLGLLSAFVAWRAYQDLRDLSRNGVVESVEVLERRVDKDALGTKTQRYLIEVDGRPRWVEAVGRDEAVGERAWLRRLPGRDSIAELYPARPSASAWRGSRHARLFWMAVAGVPLCILSGIAVLMGYGLRGVRGALHGYAQATRLGYAPSRRVERETQDDES
ncbi:MAG: hypothetical protein VX836_11085 [Pseudomonadota bacterium]|nr:hypothetical protein [Pseudomonadota bacterium]